MNRRTLSVSFVRLSMTATLTVALTVSAFAQGTATSKTIGKIVREDSRLDELVPRDAKIEVLASGFTWTEGPVWVKDGGYLLFSDIPRNSIFKWKEGEGISLFLSPSGYTGTTYYGLEPGCNGLTLDPKGQLVACEHGDRRVSVLTRHGGKRTLVDNYQGKRLNSPNDCCFNKEGDLYFTDPPYGLPLRENDPRRELDHFGVYRVSWTERREGAGLGERGEVTGRISIVHPEPELTLLTTEMTRPNGIALSPDEKTLYVAQSDPAAAIWKAFPVKGNGTLGESKVLYDVTEHVGKLPGLPDGLKVDRQGHLFATGPGGVWIFTPEGEFLGRIHTGERTANCGWGGDGSTLYICADTHICRIKTTTKGAGW
jgi:gluconolactonase